MADERLLIQIFINLLSNAVKFTPDRGRIEISARLDETGGIVVSFADSGIGMRDEDIQRALEPYRQVESDQADQQEGTGLGLALCQRFMQLFDGTLKIASQQDIGTTVTLIFPAERTVR